MTTTAITGSASGIGAAVRARLAAAGDRVIGIDLRDAEIEADLSTSGGRDDAIARTRKLCADRLDRLVVCAGVATSTKPFSLIASVNYFGAVDLIDGLRPALERGVEPAAIAIASNSARLAPLGDHPYVEALLSHDESLARELADRESFGFVPYAGSKLALATAVRLRAADWGEAGVRLNAVAPGPVDTPLLHRDAADPQVGKGIESLRIPLGRYASPDEIAALVSFLLGPEAGYVHGAVWYVDGGIDAVARPAEF